MEVPPNLGANYTLKFRQMYVELAEQNDVLFIPFVLEGVGGCTGTQLTGSNSSEPRRT